MKIILKKWQMLLMLVLTLGITACSDDNGGNGDNGDDDGDNLSDILFENGTQLGNGADEMEINGNYKLPKGVYVMWVAVVLLVILVQIFQVAGDKLTLVSDKRRR